MSSVSNNKIQGFWPVLFALLGNVFVTLIKFVAFLISGSAVLFSESIPSLADTANQSLLIVGLKRSRKKPNEEFVYGFGRERFFWGLVSACGIFFIGAGATVYHGIVALTENNDHIIYQPIMFLLLALALIIESITFYIAIVHLRKNNPGKNWFEVLKDGDPSTLTVFYEDGIAVLGVLVAFTGIILSLLTGNNYWDALGSIVVGLLLGLAAIILVLKNRSYLLGRSIPADLQEGIIEILETDPAVERVLDFKSTTLDLGVYRIKCEIEFNGNVLISDIFRQSELKAEYDRVKSDFEEFKKFCVDYTDRVPRVVGNKIDEIEKKIKKQYEGVKYIDLEIN